ncbi:MAG: DNA/RNA nuclease SfsA [Gammaproteobacteria bacterium]
MRFKSPLTEAVLIKRMIKFLVLVALPQGKKIIVRCPNFGPLLGSDVLGSRVWFSNPLPPPVEYLHTLEIVEVDGGHLVAINPEHTRPLILEAIRQDLIPELQGYQVIHTNAHPNIVQGYNLPLDILLKKNQEQCFMDVQLLTYANSEGQGIFPETSGAEIQHLHRLIAIKQNGHRAILCYCVQHSGANNILLSERHDPLYHKLLKHAMLIGVEVIAYKAKITLNQMQLELPIPILLHEDLPLPKP